MAKPSRRAASVNSDKASPKRASPKPSVAPRKPPPNPASPANDEGSHAEAVALYEHALRTLQHRDYGKAGEYFRQVIARFPHERELLDRSRLYAAFCDRHVRPPAAEPANSSERLYAATLALNAGDPVKAISYLSRVRNEEPTNDRALYLLAVAYSERGETRVAIPYLQRAIDANPENRSLARVDPDLARLRAHEEVVRLLDARAPRGLSQKDTTHKR